jgi:hypothetical protein
VTAAQLTNPAFGPVLLDGVVPPVSTRHLPVWVSPHHVVGSLKSHPHDVAAKVEFAVMEIVSIEMSPIVLGPLRPINLTLVVPS